MKNILLVAALFVSLSVAHAQKGVPAIALSDFKTKFPTAEKVSWDKEDGSFEAEFKMGKIKMSATYSAKGEWLETETGIAVAELPTNILGAFKKEHGAATIKSVYKIESAKPLAYELEYKDGVKTKEVIYDAQGAVRK